MIEPAMGRRLYNKHVTVYMWISAFWFIAGGLSYRFTYERLEENETFEYITSFIGLRFWGLVMLFFGVLAIGAALHPREKGIRIFLSASVFIKVLFGCVLLAAGTWSPAAISYLALAGIDALMATVQYSDRG